MNKPLPKAAGILSALVAVCTLFLSLATPENLERLGAVFAIFGPKGSAIAATVTAFLLSLVPIVTMLSKALKDEDGNGVPDLFQRSTGL